MHLQFFQTRLCFLGKRMTDKAFTMECSIVKKPDRISLVGDKCRETYDILFFFQTIFTKSTSRFS